MEQCQGGAHCTEGVGAEEYGRQEEYGRKGEWRYDDKGDSSSECEQEEDVEREAWGMMKKSDERTSGPSQGNPNITLIITLVQCLTLPLTLKP